MFEDEHLLEGGRCGSASHCETLSIAVASLSHQIILSQPPIAFTCSISLSAVFPLRTSPPGRRITQVNYVAVPGEDEFAWLNESAGYQGNGEGPSAM